MNKRWILYFSLVLLCCGALVLMVNAAGSDRPVKMKPGTPVPESSSAYETRAMRDAALRGAEAEWKEVPIPPEEEDRMAREREAAKAAMKERLIPEMTPAQMDELTPEQKAYFDAHGWPRESSEGGSPLDNQGGPDAFGYRFVDNMAPDTATYSWIELRGDPGTTWITFPSFDDAISAKYAIGFSFPFYGSSYDSFRVCTNGHIQFTTSATSLSNACLPNSAIAGPAIFPYWDDLHLQRGGIPSGLEVVGYKNFGNYTVIEFDSIGPYTTSCPNSSFKFEVILFNNGRIKMQYNNLVYGTNTICDSTQTIGIQANGTAGSAALNYVCNLTGIQPANGRAIWFFQPPGLQHDLMCNGIVSPTTGNYAPNDVVSVTFNVRNIGILPDGGSVRYRFNNGATVSDTVNTLQPGQIYPKTFSTQITLPGTIGDYELLVWTDLGTDLDRSNDTCRMTVRVRECADLFLNAPGTISGNTTGAGDDCNLRVGAEQIVAVTIPTAGDWTFSLCGGNPAWDTYIYLTTQCCGGTTLATDDDRCVTYSLASEIYCLPLNAGTYYLDIEPFSSASGTWILNVYQCLPCPDVTCTPTVTESEPNGGCRATPNELLNDIVCGDVISGTVTATASTRDYDGYRLVVNTPQTLTITLQPEFDGTIALYSDTVGTPCPDVSEVTVNAAGECSTEVLTRVVLPGQYHIYVYPPLLNIPIPKDYCLTVNCAAYNPPTGWDCSNPVDIQDVVSLSGETNCGFLNVYSNTCLGLYDGGEDIIYRWTVTQAGSYQITLNPYTSTYSGILLDDNCPPDVTGCIAYHTSSSAVPHSIPCQYLTPGVYYLMVDTWPSPTCIPQFDLTISTAACAPCELVCGGTDVIEVTENHLDPQFYNNDPDGGCNSNPDQFGTIACGDTICGRTFTYVRTDTTPNVNMRDTDWYLYTVTQAESLAISVVAEFPVLFGLIDYQNTVPCDTSFFLASLTRTDTCVWNTVRTPCLRPGSYVVFVAPSVFTGIPTPRDYRLTIGCIPGCYVPNNDDCASAENVVIPPNGSVTRTGSTASADVTCIDTCDYDSQSRDVFYRFTLGSCRLIELSLEGAAGSGDMHLSVYNDGQCCVLPALYCNDDWNNFTPRPTWATHTPSYSLASFIADSMGPGTYYVRVARYSTGSGPFTFTLYDNGPCSPCDTTIRADSVTVYRVDLSRPDSCMEVRYYAPLTGNYAIYSTTDRNAVYPTGFVYEATVNSPTVGVHAWRDPATFPGGLAYKRYVVIRLCPQP